MRWNGLANGSDQSFSIADPEIVSDIKTTINKRLSLRIDGAIEYETFFGEVFETEFSFTIADISDFGFTLAKDKPGLKMMKTNRILNSYIKISG